MTPYVKSGRSAQRQLEARRAISRGDENRCISSLRGFKQVINLLGVAAIFLVPLFGVMANSAPVAMVVALVFLGVIVVLELLERRVKRELMRIRELRRRD